MPEEDRRPQDSEGGELPFSDTDAMGRDKRRQVVGGQYGASRRKQLTVYGIFLAFAIGLAIAFLTVVSSIDNREIPLENTAPWAEASADLSEPRPIDFPANGPEGTIPSGEIDRAIPPGTGE